MTVSGRVVADGKPVSGHVIGIYPDQMQEFEARLFTRSSEIATDENGMFEFVAVHPEIRWNIYSLVENGVKPGLIETEEFETGAVGQIKKLGDFDILPVHKIKGTIQIVDGTPLPKKIRVFLECEHAWNHDQMIVGDDGKFEFVVPVNELVTIRISVDGYQLSRSKNKFQIDEVLAFPACLDKKTKEYQVWLEPK